MFSLSKSVVVLGLSVLLALEGIQEEERQSSVCVLLEGRTFPVGRKNFSCWKGKYFSVGWKNFSCRMENFFLKFDQKVLNFRKFEWFTDGQLENFFLSDGKFFLVVGKFFSVGMKFFSSCRENIFLSEGRTRNARRI